MLLLLLLLPKGSCCISGTPGRPPNCHLLQRKMLCKKSRTAISRGSLPARHKSAKLFLLRKLSTCGPLPSAPEMQACHSAYRVIKPSSGSTERGHEVWRLQRMWRRAEAFEGGVLFMCFSHFSAWQSACYPPAGWHWSISCGSISYLTFLTSDVLTLSCKTSSRCLPSFSGVVTACRCVSLTAHYPGRLRWPFRRRAGGRHSKHHGKSDDRKRRLHGAIRGPEDDGR